MDDKTQKIQEPAPAAEHTATAQSGEKSAAQSDPFVTKGQKFHKWTTYLGIDWFFNTFTGVSFAYLTKYTEKGQKYWSGPITNFFEKILKPVIKEETQRKKSAGYGNIFMSIIAGGMFTLPPLLYLEDNKVRKSITKFYDKIIYGKDKVENDPKFEEAYTAIDKAPEKDFGTGMWARGWALAPLLAIVLIPFTKKASNKVLFDHVEHGSEAVAKKLGYSPASFKVPAAEAQERWKFIHESVAMDFGLCLPYAVMHKFWYDKLADKKHAKATGESAVATDTPVASPSHAGKFTDKALAVSASHAARETTRRVEAENSPVLGA